MKKFIFCLKVIGYFISVVPPVLDAIRGLKKGLKDGLNNLALEKDFKEFDLQRDLLQRNKIEELIDRVEEKKNV